MWLLVILGALAGVAFVAVLALYMAARLRIVNKREDAALDSLVSTTARLERAAESISRTARDMETLRLGRREP